MKKNRLYLHQHIRHVQGVDLICQKCTRSEKCTAVLRINDLGFFRWFFPCSFLFALFFCLCWFFKSFRLYCKKTKKTHKQSVFIKKGKKIGSILVRRANMWRRCVRFFCNVCKHALMMMILLPSPLLVRHFQRLPWVSVVADRWKEPFYPGYPSFFKEIFFFGKIGIYVLWFMQTFQ